MASRNIEELDDRLKHAWLFAKHKWADLYPCWPQPFITCTHRTNQEQHILYQQGRTAPGKIVTWAKPGTSAHNRLPSMAFDIAFITVDKKLDWSPHLFQKFYELIKPLGLEWGGSWKTKKDAPHFEIKDWKTKIPLA